MTSNEKEIEIINLLKSGIDRVATTWDDLEDISELENM